MASRRSTASTILLFLAGASLLSCGGSATLAAPQATQFPQVAGLAQRQVQFQHVIYPFYVFVPSSSDKSHSLPAILLIHGFGGKGPDMIGEWKAFAEQNGIILVAPTLPLGGNFETAVAPQLYPAMMDAARREWSIDAKRIYLFGYSAGGYTVYDAGMLDSQYFAAGGVFAAVITTDYDWILKKAARKIPIAIYIGDHDQFFTVTQAQETSALLTANGFPVRLTIFQNHDHNYGALADIVNPDVWNFFTKAPPP